MDRKQLSADIEAKKLLVKSCKEQFRQAESDLSLLETEFAEKPKLRGGDYGVWNTGEFWIVLYRGGILETFGSSNGAGMKASEMPLEKLTILGNIINESAALSGSVTQLKQTELGIGTRDGYLLLRQDEAAIDIDIKDLHDFIRNLQITEATLKRKNAKS